MDILIPDSWLREFLETRATPQKIGECLSLCGPSVEKITKSGKDWVYYIEVTTNRVDSASVYGIAREGAAILPQFSIKAKLKPIVSEKIHPKSKLKISIFPDEKNQKRIMAIVLENVKNISSPKWMTKRLEDSGVRSLNILVDITNYIMLETGHPTHVFDYDKIKTKKLIFRLSKKGEEIETFDGKKHNLPGDDIVIDDGTGKIIDLPGIMGTKNSVIDKDTKNIIFFIDNNDPIKIRRTSLAVNERSLAAILNEKGVDPELADVAFNKGVLLYEKLANGKVASQIYDFHPKQTPLKPLSIKLEFIEKVIGIPLQLTKVINILESLDFEIKTNSKEKSISVKVPSSRKNDIQIPEDLVEEVARINGYQNLPSEIMSGKLPDQLPQFSFDFEKKVKDSLKTLGAIEVYTLSLTSKINAGHNALKLKNPLGTDSEYLRTTLKHSLITVARENSFEKNAFHIFEMANVYITRKKAMPAGRQDLPEERMTLSGIFVNYDYRKAKGALELFLETLGIQKEVILEKIDNQNLFYYEFEMLELQKNSNNKKYYPIPKYPPQIEDITIVLPENSKVLQIIHLIKEHKFISNVEFLADYNNAYSFRIYYQNPDKTLTNKEVEVIREKILEDLNKKFGARIKD